AILGVLAFGWVRENVLIPNQTIVTVNGVNIPQDAFRKEMDYTSQTTWNVLENEILQQNAIASQAQAGNANAVNANNILTPEIQSEEANFTQSSLSALAVANLIENQLIVNGAHTFEREHHLPTSTFEPSDRAVNAGLGNFKRAFPKNESYSDFLSKDHLTNADVLNGIRMDLRRQLMQKYLAAQLVSPTVQIDMRHIETNTLAQAQSVNTQLAAKKYSDAEWKTLALKDSLDTNTKQVGGDLGWIASGSGDAAIEIWAFTSSRKVGDVTTLRDANGTFDVVQILQINLHRAVDASTLAANKGNALTHWLSGQKTPGINTISTPNSGMLSDSRNQPTLPNLNATLPNESGQNGTGTGGATGLP
ncbi:MAG TPA: peptidylprolyl isomerase, partial [Ktedonobacterales bacterium]|nr:peptidylprolyl isomerase [Ktedonobacterales bacterium]